MSKNKYYNIQIVENINVGLAGANLDIRFHVSEGLTKEQIDDFDDKIQELMNQYGEENDDYADMDYHEIVEQAAEALNIKIEYPAVDYTICL